jgi:hypothetical protein
MIDFDAFHECIMTIVLTEHRMGICIESTAKWILMHVMSAL